MSLDDRADIFEQAVAAGVGSSEIVDAAEEAGIELGQLERELRHDARELWAAVEDEVETVRRLEDRLEGRRVEVRELQTDIAWPLVILLLLGMVSVVTVLGGAAVGGLVYLVTNVLGGSSSIFASPVPELLGGLLAFGVFAIVVGFTLAERPSAPLARVTEACKALEEHIAAATDVLATALLEQGVLPRLRELIDRRLQDSYALQLSIESSVGLAEPFHPRFEISTPARRELERILATRSGANVGLAGPRGVGKTTLIVSVTRAAQDDRICVRAAAPVQYEPREFLLHLFALLCEAVLEREGVRRGPAPPAAVPESAPLRRARGAASALADALLQPTRALFGAIGRSTFSLVPRADSDRDVQRLSPLARQARELLDQIRFQQTHTQGWSGTLQAPAIASAQLQGGRSYAREPMTFPDVVAGLRTFAAQLGRSAKVIVGIDELDKMEDEERAERFLNDIKAIFDVRNCFYLLAVSEDALSRFERRGVPVRDAFDSSLDEIVLVTPLDLAGATALVRRRVIGMPVPFVALAHCVSGGIPRELLRVVRRMVVIADQAQEPPTLVAVAERLLRDDLLRKIAAVTTRSLDDNGAVRAAALFTWASELKAVQDGGRLRMIVRSIATEAAGEAGLRAYAYFVLTLLELFDERLDEAILRDAMAASDAGGLERLAEGRQAFAFGPQAAWNVLAAFREAHRMPGPRQLLA